MLQETTPADEPSSLHPQDDHATDEEKLASSTSHKWATLHDMDADLNSDQHDFPHPSDLTSFVNENSLPLQAPGKAYCSFLTLVCLSFSPATCAQTNANRDQSIPQTDSTQRKFKAYVWMNRGVQQSATFLFIDFCCGTVKKACWPSFLLPSDPQKSHLFPEAIWLNPSGSEMKQRTHSV